MTARALPRAAVLAPAQRPAVRNGDRLTLALMLAIAYCVASAIHEVGWAEGTGFLVWDAWLAVVMAYALARSPLPTYLAVPVGVIVGLEAVLLAVGNLWPPLAYVRSDLAQLGPWLERARWGQWHGLAGPFPETSGYVLRQADAIAGRLWTWLARAGAGEPNNDRQVWLLLVACALLVVTLFAAWQLFRHWRSSLAVVPMGLALGVNGHLAGQRPFWALIFVGLAVALIVRGHARGLERHWQGVGVDYSDELVATATWIGLAVAVAAMALSPLVPALSSRATYEAFWRLLRGPWEKVEDTTGKLFGGLNSPRGRNDMIGGGEATPDAAAGHRVGSGAPVGTDIVMTVRIDDAAPEPWAGEIAHYEAQTVPQRHWRAATYERYTGSGWENGEYEQVPYEHDTPLPMPGADASTRKESHQEFTLRRSSSVYYAVGQPFSFEDSVRVNQRDGGDVVSIEGGTYSYTAVSLVPDVTIADLDAAGEVYPDWVSERYLALPELPQRLVDLVTELLAGADTPYGKARAIEAYLRQFPYDLDVPQAPEGRDVVDYFLFDLQRGYCDYYATAMTVMLRQAGVPARLAIGYARGSYDRDRAAWIVRESDAHAWVEVFFPTYGWIEFEPTVSQSTYVYPSGGYSDFDLAPLDVPVSSGVGWHWPLSSAQTRRAAGVVAGATLLLALLVRAARRMRFGPERWAREAYGSTVAAAAWVGVTPGANETVREYWQRLRKALADETVFVSTPWGTEWVWQFDQVTRPLRYVLAAYEQSLFAREAVSNVVARHARESASLVRRQMALLWLARRLGE